MSADSDPMVRRVAPGWREWEGARVCLLEVETAFASLYRAYFDEVGSSAGYFLYLAGQRTAALWVARLESVDKSGDLPKALASLERRGFGAFALDPGEVGGATAVVVHDSMEAWSIQRSRLSTGKPACHYTAGLLAGIFPFVSTVGDIDDVVCWETSCRAAGADRCRFEIGTADRLKARGLVDPWHDRGVRWQMQALNRKLQVSTDKLTTVERNLADRQEAYQSLLDNMNDVLLVLDSEKRLVYANKSFLDNSHLTLDQAVGRSPLEWIFPDDRAEVEAAYDDLLTGRKLQATYRFRVRRGPNLTFVESSARRIRGLQGVTLIETIGRDITERESTRQQLETALAQLTHKQQGADNDLRVAKSVHESLLPGPVNREEIDLDIKYRPVDRVGGDYCHVHFPGERECLLTVCDVSGHGVASALLASRVSSFLQAAARKPQDPLQLTTDLNSFLLKYFSETGLFVTFFAIAIDLESFEMRYCGAGHPPPFIWRRDSNVIESLTSENLPVGILDQFQRQTTSDKTRLEPGDRLLIYTDGVTETAGEDRLQLGIGGLRKLFAQSSSLGLFEVGDWLLERVSDFAATRPHDDMTFLMLEAKFPRQRGTDG